MQASVGKSLATCRLRVQGATTGFATNSSCGISSPRVPHMQNEGHGLTWWEHAFCRVSVWLIGSGCLGHNVENSKQEEYLNWLMMSAMGADERMLACVSRACYPWTRSSLRSPLGLSDIIIMIMSPDLLWWIIEIIYANNTLRPIKYGTDVSYYSNSYYFSSRMLFFNAF